MKNRKNRAGRTVVVKKRSCFLKVVCLGMICICISGGCSGSRGQEEAQENLQQRTEETASVSEHERAEISAEKDNGAVPESDREIRLEDTGSEQTEPEITEPEVKGADWSEYFEGLNGAAVVYDLLHGRYVIYNQELARTRRSPCSTFKIVSSLIALENGVIDPDHAVRAWSGETFWNEAWNQDMDFPEAFRESCVWYFREVVNEIGQERMQAELEKLKYGNCDSSDWEGRQNTNNNNPALTGFWIESSLTISPKEQTEVMERIFGADSVYSADTQNRLKQVMLVTEQSGADVLIYGKTGMGKAEGIVVDAWFTGFAQSGKRQIYFCVYLGRNDGQNVSSVRAREIAVRLVSDYFGA